jgi:hypothetical protein
VSIVEAGLALKSWYHSRKTGKEWARFYKHRKAPAAPATWESSFLVAHYARTDCDGFPAGRLGSHKGAFYLSSGGSDPLKTDWQRHVLASSGYLELGMFDDAAMVLEEIAPEDKNRKEVQGCAFRFTWRPKS